MNDRKAIWSLAIGQTLFWAGLYYTFPALIVRWQEEFGWSKSELTAGLTLALLTSAIVSPLTGRMIDKGKGAPLLALGGIIGGFFLGFLGFVSSLPVFYGLWIGLGACMACCLYEPCFSFLVKNKGVAAQRPITIITLVAGLAGTICFPLSHAIADFAGWRSAIFFFVALIWFVGAPLIWFGAKAIEKNAIAEGGLHDEIIQEEKHRYGFLTTLKFWFLAFSFMLIYMNHSAIISHFLLLLKERQFDPDLAVLAITFMGPMQVLGRFSMMVLERRFSSVIGSVLSFSFVTLASLSMIWSTSIPALLVSFIILQGTGIGIMTIMKPMIIRQVLGEVDYGLKAGAQAVPFLIGSAFAALIGSFIWGIGGYDLVLKALFVAPVLGLIFFLFAVALTKREQT